MCSALFGVLENGLKHFGTSGGKACMGDNRVILSSGSATILDSENAGG